MVRGPTGPRGVGVSTEPWGCLLGVGEKV
jgi:hypothetical protein